MPVFALNHLDVTPPGASAPQLEASEVMGTPSLPARLSHVSFSSQPFNLASDATFAITSLQTGWRWHETRLLRLFQCEKEQDPELDAILTQGKKWQGCAERQQQILASKGAVTSSSHLPFTRTQSLLLGIALWFSRATHAIGLGWQPQSDVLCCTTEQSLSLQGGPLLDMTVDTAYRRHVRSAPAGPDVSRTQESHSSQGLVPFLTHLALQAQLPAALKEVVIDSLVQDFHQIERIVNKRYSREWLRHLDILLLERGFSAGPYQIYYKKIGGMVRKLLEKQYHFTHVRQYIKENAPHNRDNRAPIIGNLLLNEYVTVLSQHQLLDSQFFNSSSTLLDAMILKTCKKRFSTLSEIVKIPPLGDTYPVEFIRKYTIFLLRPYTTHSFTVREYFLGHHRRAALQEGNVEIAFPKKTHPFLRKMLSSVPDITDVLAKEFDALFVKLKQDEKLKTLLQSTVRCRVAGIVVNSLDDFPTGKVPKLLELFLTHEIKPQLVLVSGKVLPNLLALSSPRYPDIFLISLLSSDVKSFEKNRYSADLKLFVYKHLSHFDRQRVESNGLAIGTLCGMGMSLKDIPERHCSDASLGFEYDENYTERLYQAMLDMVEVNINSVTYTTQEYMAENQRFAVKRALLTASILAGILAFGTTSPVLVALLGTVGVSAGIGEMFTNLAIADHTDDGAIYENALSEAAIGAWFMSFGSLADIALGQAAILNKFKSYQMLGVLKGSVLSTNSFKVSGALRKLIKPHMYEKIPHPGLLSLPDAKGLQWSVERISYLKVDEHYVRATNRPNTRIYDIGESPIQARLTESGELVPVKHPDKPSRNRGAMFSKGNAHLYKESRHFREIKVPGRNDIDKVGYRTLADNHYALFYTQPRNKNVEPQGSKTLVASAHGGYFSSDLNTPPVVLPEDMTIKLLAPHGTYIEDPGLESLVNLDKRFKAFLTIYNSEYDVNYVRQAHSEWRFLRGFDPYDPTHVLGRTDGLHNYRHGHFDQESPRYVAEVVLDNRKLVREGLSELSDVIVLNDKISLTHQTDLAKASVQRLMDLDLSGELLNAAGERYNTIVLAHCRCNLAVPEKYVSVYKVQFPSPSVLSPQATKVRITRTVLHRRHSDMPFSIKEDVIGDMAFISQ